MPSRVSKLVALFLAVVGGTVFWALNSLQPAIPGQAAFGEFSVQQGDSVLMMRDRARRDNAIRVFSTDRLFVDGKYKVESGDNLQGILETRGFVVTGDLLSVVLEMNPQVRFVNQIFPGQVLVLPQVKPEGIPETVQRQLEIDPQLLKDEGLLLRRFGIQAHINHQTKEDLSAGAFSVRQQVKSETFRAQFDTQQTWESFGATLNSIAASLEGVAAAETVATKSSLERAKNKKNVLLSQLDQYASGQKQGRVIPQSFLLWVIDFKEELEAIVTATNAGCNSSVPVKVRTIHELKGPVDKLEIYFTDPIQLPGLEKEPEPFASLSTPATHILTVANYKVWAVNPGLSPRIVSKEKVLKVRCRQTEFDLPVFD